MKIICDAKVHCRHCRRREKGAGFRRSLMSLEGGPKEQDFTCPHGNEWIEEVVVKVKRLGLSERTATSLIDDAPDDGTWHDLKHMLRVTRDAVAMKPNASACWRRRQFRRIRDMLTHAKRKGLITLAA